MVLFGTLFSRPSSRVRVSTLFSVLFEPEITLRILSPSCFRRSNALSSSPATAPPVDWPPAPERPKADQYDARVSPHISSGDVIARPGISGSAQAPLQGDPGYSGVSSDELHLCAQVTK